jgi:ribosomal RNA-processing protein 17
MSKRPKRCIERQGRKLVLKFDEASRRDYLLGFHRRKEERRKKAKLAKEMKEKEDRRLLKAERRQEMKKRQALSAGTLPDIEDEAINGSGSKKVVEYEHKDHIVTVTTEIDLNLDVYSRLQANRAHVQEEGPAK